MSRAQSGQALAELAIAAPLAALLFFIAFHLAQVLLARAELAQVARGLALARGRAYEGDADADKDRELLKRLVKATHLDIQRLDLAEEGISPLDALASAQDCTDNQVTERQSMDFLNLLLGKIMGKALGQRLTLTYHYRFDGPLKRLLPEEIALTERLACKSGVWKVQLKL